MKICIVTLSNRKDAYIKYANTSKQIYADKHENVDFIFMDEIILKDKSAVWSKMPAILKVINNYDYVIWMDDDAMIINFDFDCEQYLDDHDIYYTNDISGLNFGVFVIKNSENGKNFLNEILNHYEKFRYGWQEQTCAQFLLKNNGFEKFAKELPANIWNAYLNIYDYTNVYNLIQEDSFILHMPAKSANVRNDTMKNKLKELGIVIDNIN